MKIERNYGSIFARREKPTVTRYRGFSSGNDIYQSPQSFIDGISTYCHEVGHVLGDRLSFQAGLKWWQVENVRSLDEIKNYKISIYLEPTEIQYLRKSISNKKNTHINDEGLIIAGKLLNTFSMGNFHPRMVNFHNISQRELEKILAREGSSTTKTANGEVLPVNSRAGRDSEIPSFTTEVACLLLLENTLIKYRINFNESDLGFCTSSSPSHQRAINIVSGALSRKGWRLPSMVDIAKRPSN